MHKILLTCPPMIGMVDEFERDFAEEEFDVEIPNFSQEMTETDLCEIIGNYDGWIIGDDPASSKVVQAGASGKLKACMRWGVGTDNVDFDAFKKFGIPIENTPGVFGREVADLACHYVTALARDTYNIDSQVKNGNWFKPVGKSLWNARALIVGFGDIGQNVAKRLKAHDVEIWYTDPNVTHPDVRDCIKVTWPHAMSHVDFIVFTAPLNDQTYHMLNMNNVSLLGEGTQVVNVGRGPLIEESALIEGLETGKINKAALDVFEVEPLQLKRHSELLKFKHRLILGSHNGSNTKEAVSAVSKTCISKLSSFLNG